jgi:O-antigen/teichoic acid export membrane protein
MNRTERIFRNVSSNWVGFAINALVTLALTPFVLGKLGIERYGVWILITSFIGYYGMLDLGFRAGVNQLLTRSVAAGNHGRASTVMSTALAGLALLGVIVVVLTVIAAAIVPTLFDLPTAARREATICILLVGSAAAWQIALSPFASVFVAVQRFDISNLIGISMRLLGATGIVLVLQQGFGLIGVAAITASTTVLGYLIRWLVALRLLPGLNVSRQSIDLSELRNIGSFGIWYFLMSVTEYIYLHFLPIVVAANMPVAAVGHYALAAGLWHQINALFTPIGQVLYPAAAELHVKQERDTLGRLYKDGTRLLLLVVLPVTLVASIWADDFYRLWIGDVYLTGETFVSVALLLQVMLVATFIGYFSNIASQILMGAGHIRPLAILKTSGAVFALLLTIIFIRDVGLIVIPLSVVAAVFLVDIIGIPVVLYKTEGLDFREFLRSVWLRMSLIGAGLAILFAGMKVAWLPTSWPALIAQGAAAGACAMLAIWYFGINQQERKQLVVQPLQKIFARRSR